MATFNKCISVTLKHEGGYSNDPDDAGKETYMGISRKSFPDWEGWPIIDAHNANTQLKTGQFIDNPELDKMVHKFYYNEFWMPLQLISINNENSAFQIFDFAVNCGIHKAVITAQRLSGTYVDGKMGPNTIAAINNAGEGFYSRYMHARKEHYIYLAKIKPVNAKFLQGWLNRVESRIYV